MWHRLLTTGVVAWEQWWRVYYKTLVMKEYEVWTANRKRRDYVLAARKLPWNCFCETPSEASTGVLCLCMLS